jgi:uncharacterized cupin superfamily protein
MPKIDVKSVPLRTGSGYPSPFCDTAGNRIKQALGLAAGLGQFGVNLTRLPPQEWSSQRHWHPNEDEFVYVLEGELTLIEEGGETVLRAGECAGFARGVPNGHHFVNKSATVAVYLEVGTRTAGDDCHYPDVDLFYDGKADRYTHKNGAPYPDGG